MVLNLKDLNFFGYIRFAVSQYGVAMTDFAWGNEETKYFYKLTPEKVLDAVESSGLCCTGRCMALNSMENRVYEVEIETDGLVKTPSEKFRVVKFYRPGRWSLEQILEEHAFLLELLENEIPVVAPLKFDDGKTLHKDEATGIWYALFKKVGGRSPDEFSDDQLERIGRLLARIHNVGASSKALHRLEMNPKTFGLGALSYLLENNKIPAAFMDRYKNAVQKICEISTPWFSETGFQRVHGDCHLGNLLWNAAGPFFLDFDDMVRGPCVQDLWLIVSGRDAESKEKFEVLLSSYEQMREFDRRTLRLIEPLRALRFVHFNAWKAKRWDDPSFPRAFPYFGTEKYWSEQTVDIEEQLELIQTSVGYNYMI